MTCVRNSPSGGEKPASRGRLARALWTPRERRAMRLIVEERLIWGWGCLFEEEMPLPLVVRPAWRLKPTERQRYVEAVHQSEEARLADEALTWFRRFLVPLAHAPRGSRPREKYETFILWLNCRAHRPGHPTFNSIWEARAGGDVKLARKLKRQAYRRVERAIRIVKLGLFMAGESPEPLPERLRHRPGRKF